MLIHASLIGIFLTPEEEIEPAWRFEDDGGGGDGEEGSVSDVRLKPPGVGVCVCLRGLKASRVCAISVAWPDHKQKKEHENKNEMSLKRLCGGKENSHTSCTWKISTENQPAVHLMARPDKGTGARCLVPLSSKRCATARQEAYLQAGLGTACVVYAKLKTFSSFVVGPTFTTSELCFGWQEARASDPT